MKLIRKLLGYLGFGYYVTGGGVDKFCTEYLDALEWMACARRGETVECWRWYGGDWQFVSARNWA